MKDWEPTDYDTMSRVYDAGRAMPDEWVTEWREVLAGYLTETGGPVADVGSGTGIWAHFLVDWFGVDVVGIEPSVGMRGQAADNRTRAGIAYVAGDAEHLPLRNDSCGAVWMSTVVHHVSNLETAAYEARRVLRDGGPLLIRQAFSGRHNEIPWTQVFPAALQIAEQRHPMIETVVDTFETAGFRWESTHRVKETSAADLDEYATKVETRADSCLALISDEEFEAGMAELKSLAERADRKPVTTGLDLLVLR